MTEKSDLARENDNLLGHDEEYFLCPDVDVVALFCQKNARIIGWASKAKGNFQELLKRHEERPNSTLLLMSEHLAYENFQLRSYDDERLMDGKARDKDEL